MSEFLKFNAKYAGSFIPDGEKERLQKEAQEALAVLTEGTGEGNDFIGWRDLPAAYDREEYARIQKAAQKIRSDSEVLVVIGIGGSYLGARAAIEFLSESGQGPEIFYAGNSVSGDYLSELIRKIGDRDYSVNVISKSGTTTEAAIAFRIFKALIEKKYGKKEAASRIYATTDKARGALKTLAQAEGYEQFTVPDDVGGRYSVLTAVGLLPIAVAGIDTDALLLGAQEMRSLALSAAFEENPVLQYAVYRNAFYRAGKKIEVLSNYEPSFHYIGEWWKQLYGESEGKDQKGIFPAAVDLTTDLHSMGQYIQDGERILMETVVELLSSRETVTVPSEAENLDGLNYLAGMPLHEINREAMKGTILAHNDGGVPVMKIELPARDARSLGQLFCFFEFACGVSGYMLGVNPFNQPGVESYKKNMFGLLGKPGYEELGAELKKKV